MTPLSRPDLDRLMSSHGDTHASIHLPTVRVGDQTQQTKVRFKNQLQTAEGALSELGKPHTEVAVPLEPAHRSLNNDDHWQRQLEGPALFNRQQGIRLFRGDRQGAEPLPLSGAPEHLSQFLRFDDPEAQLQRQTETGRLAVATGQRGSVLHDHGAGGKGKVQTADLLCFLRRPEQAVCRRLPIAHGPGQHGPPDIDRLIWPQVEARFEEELPQVPRRLRRAKGGQLSPPRFPSAQLSETPEVAK